VALLHFISLLFAGAVSAQGLTVTLPAGCVSTPAAAVVTCGAVPVCPPGTTGTPPNCVPIPPGPTSCPGFPSTLNATLPWTAPQSSLTTSTIGGFPANGALVVKFTTPAVIPNAKIQGSFNIVEYQGPPAPRSGSLSATACDFVGGLGGQDVFVNDNAPVGYYWFSTQTQPKGQNFPVLLPATTYYFNVSNPKGCSPGPDCDLKLTLQLPR